MRRRLWMSRLLCLRRRLQNTTANAHRVTARRPPKTPIITVPIGVLVGVLGGVRRGGPVKKIDFLQVTEKRATTCFATLLENELNSDVARFTTHIKPV